jgi:hypothetical protein
MTSGTLFSLVHAATEFPARRVSNVDELLKEKDRQLKNPEAGAIMKMQQRTSARTALAAKSAGHAKTAE